MDGSHRPEPPISGSEKDVLIGFLDFLRQTILWKADGLSDNELRRPHEPSGLTLLGTVKHLAYVERWWFQTMFLDADVAFPWTDDDPDADWRVEPDETTQAIRDLYRQEIEIANRIVAEHDLDETIRSTARPEREGMQLRWVVAHMIEETARHCGHADLIRQAIDGQTGE